MSQDPAFDALQARARETAVKAFRRAAPLWVRLSPKGKADLERAADNILNEAKAYFYQRLRDMTVKPQSS